MLDFSGEQQLGMQAGAAVRRPRQILAQRLLGDVVLLTTIPGIRPVEPASSSIPDQDERRYTVLVHSGDNGSARSRIVCSDSAAGAVDGMQGGLRAVAVPDRMLPPHSRLPEAMALTDTALVRASRAIVHVLFSAAPDDEYSDSTGAAEDVVVAVVRGILREQRPTMAGATDGDEFDHRVWAMIADRHSDPTFGVDTIARELAFSRRHLYRRVSGGAGVAALIAQHRLSTAMRLIGEDPSKPLADVASSSGFSRLANMRALFAARLGVTPTNYRRSITSTRG